MDELRIMNLFKLECKEYEFNNPKSKQIFSKGGDFFVNGTSHAGRNYAPYPLHIINANSSHVQSVDGHSLIDFWLGHFVNSTGYDFRKNEEEPSNLIQIGQPSEYEYLVAQKLCSATGFDKIIYTTSGSLATMHSILLALSMNSREIVLKVKGGWHGIQPFGLKDVRFPLGIDTSQSEYQGLPRDFNRIVNAVEFNNCSQLKKYFDQNGKKINCFIMELVLGNSGMVTASQEFVSLAQELCVKYNVVFIIDELVTGFRVRNGLMCELYDVKPDIVTIGKAVSGGMPFSAICINERFAANVKQNKPLRMGIDGGTFSSHYATLRTVNNMLDKFMSDSGVFDRNISFMTKIRNIVNEKATENNIPIHITGVSHDNHIPHFPIGTVRYITSEKYDCRLAISHHDSKTNNIYIRNLLSKIMLINRGIFTWQSLGCASSSLSDKDFSITEAAYGDFFKILSKIY